MNTRNIKTAITYFIGIVLSKIILILLLPLYTERIDPSIMGQYDLIQTILSFIVPIIFFQIWDAMFRFSFDYTDSVGKRRVFDNSLLIMMIGFILYTFITVGVFILFKLENITLIYFNGLIIGLNYYFLFITRVYLDNKLFSLSGVLNTIVTAIVSVMMILFFKSGIEALYVSSILGGMIQILIIGIKYKETLFFKKKYIDYSLIWKMLKFSIPLTIASGSYWLLSGYSKLFISLNIGNEANGLLSVANKFSIIILMIVSIVQFTWNESLYIDITTELEEEEKIRKQEKELNLLLSVTLIGSGLAILMIKIVFPYLVHNSYSAALDIIPISIISVMLSSFTGLMGTLFSTNKKTHAVFWTTIVAALTNVIVLNIFGESANLFLVVFISVLSYFILFILRVFFIRIGFGIKIYKRNFFSLLILLVCVSMFKYLSSISILVTLSITFALMTFVFKKKIIKILRSLLSEKNN